MPDKRDVAEQIKGQSGTLDRKFAQEGQTTERVRKFNVKQMGRVPFLAEHTTSVTQTEGGLEQDLQCDRCVEDDHGP